MDPSRPEYTQMLSCALHKIKSPLTVIRESIALIEDGTCGQITDEQKILLGRGLKNVDRLTYMLHDINEYERLLLNSTAMACGDYSVKTIIDECIDQVKPLFKQANSTCELTLPDEEIYITVDKSAFTMALKKIIVNAIQYAPSSSILLCVRSEGKSVLISVIDTGIGIHSDYINEIFKPFTRFGTTEVILEGGAGLGLTIADLIIARQGGTLTVTSQQKKGSTFTIALPQKKRV